MGRTTLGMAKSPSSRIAVAINIGPNDARFTDIVNEACRRILKRGRFWGTYSRFLTNATSQLFSPPPYIDTVERVMISSIPMPVHDLLYQFLDNGWGARDDTLPNGSGVSEMLHRGNYPTIVDIPAGGSVLTVRCDVSADVGQPVLLLGYDNATPPNWVRTVQSGVWSDGEIVLMAQGAGTQSLTTFSRLTAVQPGTLGTPLNGQWWLYAGAVVGGTLLSNYQWWEAQEKAPNYPRYLVPFVNSTITTIELLGKNAFIPAKKDSDFLTIGNLDAIKLACRAIKAEEESDWSTSNLLWEGGEHPKTKAKIVGVKQEMEYELDHYLGAGRQIGLNITGSGYGSNDFVEPLW